MKITVGKSERIMASESDGNYDKSFKAKGTTYYIEMLSDGGNYVAKWWDSSDNGLGYNNKGWVAIEGKNYRALNNIGDVNSDNVVDILSVISDYDRKPGKPIQDRIKREVAKLLDFDAINSACGKKSVKSNKIIGSDTGNSVSLYYNGRWQCSGFENAIADRLAIIMARDDKALESIVEYCNSFGDPVVNPDYDNIERIAYTLVDIFYADWNDADSDEDAYVDIYWDGGRIEILPTSEAINSSCGKKSVKASAIMGADDISGVKILVRSKAYVDITEDNYEHGASLGIVNQWDFDVRGKYDSMQDLIDDIHSVSYQVFSNNIDDYSFGDGALRTSAMVNDENDVPTDGEYEAFKRGEITLYIADMWLPLEVGSVHDMTDDEARSFGIKEIW